jgi:hypothetical protein
MVIGVAALTAGVACGATGNEEGTLGSTEQAVLTANVRVPVGGDARGYYGDGGGKLGPQGDWSYSQWKGECALNELLQGVSRNINTGEMHAMLCVGPTSVNTTPVNQNNSQQTSTDQYGTLDVTQHDDRRDTTLYRDWNTGFVKAECGRYEAMSGISQETNGHGVIDKARCVGVGAYATVCNWMDFGPQNIMQSMTYGYWDTYSAARMNTCTDGRLVKGFSKKSDGTLKAILCCQYSGIIY